MYKLTEVLRFALPSKLSAPTLAAVLTLAACTDGGLAPTVKRTDGDQFRVAASASTTISNVMVPFQQNAFVPCAVGGVGEFIVIQGTLHFIFEMAISDSGNVQIKIQYQPQGAIAIGQTTGDIYRAVGLTETVETFQADGLPGTFTLVNNFLMIGPGTDNNVQVHINLHVTVDNNDNLTAFVDNVRVTCM